MKQDIDTESLGKAMTLLHESCHLLDSPLRSDRHPTRGKGTGVMGIRVCR